MQKAVLFILCGLFLIGCGRPKTFLAEDVKTIFVDMETTKAEKILAGSYELDGANAISKEQARSGKRSIKLGPNHKKAGLIQFSGVKKGDIFIVKVWKYIGPSDSARLLPELTEKSKGTLVLTHWNGGKKEHKLESIEVIQIIKGWGLVKLHYKAKKDDENLSVYLSSSGSRMEYFDDLSIARYSGQDKRDVLRIQIPDSSMDSLIVYRQRALANKVISPREKIYVKAEIELDGKTIPIKMRLKGDWTDHLKTDKWSFRIKVRGNNAFMGLKSFSIQTPSTRGYMMEWFAHKLFDREDVLTTRYEFLPVLINGEMKGIYALEEHFDKQLLEQRNRREGPIVKFDETGFWQKILVFKANGFHPKIPIFESSDVLPFKKNRTYKSPVLREQFLLAKKNMERYRNSDSAVDEYMDEDRFGQFLALTDVLNVAHSRIWHNQRFYFNPITTRLEPVAFDCFTQWDIPKFELSGANRRNLTGRIIQYRPAQKAYARYLKKYSDSTFLHTVFEEMRDEIEAAEAIIAMEYSDKKVDRKTLFDNCREIRRLLPQYEEKQKDISAPEPGRVKVFDTIPENVLYTEVAFRAHRQSESLENSNLALLNYHLHPVKVMAYTVKGHEDSLIYLDNPIPIDAYNPSQKPIYETFNGRVRQLYYQAANCGDSLFSRKVSKWPIVEMDEHSRNIQTKRSVVEMEGNKTLIRKGNYRISSDLVIPKGTELLIEPGAKIDLVNQASIISYSPVKMVGTETEPIELYSSDKTGAGLIIWAKGQQTQMKQVHFSNLNTRRRDGWILTGAVSIYEGDLEMDNCHFANALSEDALNVVRSTFQIENCRFSGAFSDAFDADFCRGTISNSVFENIGNDCIDFSGSETTVANCTIKQAGDKGISAGERSTVTIDNCTINGAVMAVASKDRSSVNIENLAMDNCEYSFAAYCKKAEFGPATIQANDRPQNDNQMKHLIQKGSVLILSGDSLHGSKEIPMELLN